MPCRSGMTPDPYVNNREIDKLTQMLCSLIRNIHSDGKLYLIPSNVKDWFHIHEEADRKRILEEEAERRYQEEQQRLREERLKIISRAVLKLTDEEKAALGFK